MKNDNSQKYPKSPWRFLLWGCTICGGLQLLGKLASRILSWILLAEASSEAATIGIIGGADGPTAIFVTTSPGIPWLIPVFLLAAGIAGLLWLKRKAK